MSSHPRGSTRGARLRSLVAAAALTAALAPLAAAADAAPLPNGRVLELVSPPDTGGLSVRPGGYLQPPPPRVLGDGVFAMMQYFTAQFPESGNGWGALWAARRRPDGWQRELLEQPVAEQDGNATYELWGATDDLSRTIVKGVATHSVFFPGSGEQHVAPTTLTLREAGGPSRTFVTIPFPLGQTDPPPLRVAGTSDDLETVLFDTQDRLAGDTHTATNEQAYIWRNGTVRVAGVDGDGTTMDCGAAAKSASGSADTHPVSADGSIAYLVGRGQRFGPDRGCDPNAVLFAWVEGRTWPISTPDAGVASVRVTPTFVGASRDGTVAYFVTPQALTADDGNAGGDLYRSTIPAAGGARTLVCLTCGAGDAGVLEFGASITEDRSRVFFLSLNAIGGQGIDGNPDGNLFAYHDGQIELVSDSAGFYHDPTADGRHVLLQSRANVTGYDSQGLPELYRASERADGSYATSCISCDPTGAPPTTGALLINATSKQISRDGRVIAFSSLDALTPDAVAGLGNIYEWSDGTVSLIHTGQNASDPYLAGVSPSGDDLYFAAFGRVTPEALQPTDAFYDARRGGGFPVAPEPPAPCEGSACQGPVTPPPALPAVATVRFSDGRQSEEARDERRATVRLGSARVRGTTIRVDATVPMRGRISVGGARVRAISRTVAKRGAYRLAVALTPRARRQLKRAGRLTVRLRVGFQPAGDRAASSARVTVTVKR